jgi:hypothetical protein
MSPLPIGHTFGDTILYYLAAAVLLVLALALLAVLSESLIKIVRALGGALVSLPAVAIPACEHIENIACDVGGKALRVIGSGWPAIRALLDLVFFVSLAGSELYLFATRVGGMMGVDVPFDPKFVSVLLGFTFTAATAVVALTWKEEHDKAALTPNKKSQTLRWITIAGWLVIIDCIMLGIWTAEIVFVGRSDVTVAAIFLIVLTAVVCVAVGLTIHGALRGAVVLGGLLLYGLWLLFYLIATIFYFFSELVARIVAVAEAILAAPRDLGRVVWNATRRGQAAAIGPRQDPPLINAHIARPQFQRTPAPPASVVPPTPVVSPAAPQSAPPNGKTPNGAAPSNPSLGPVCARCGGSLSATARFCGQCGAGPLSSSNPPNPGASAKANAP